MITIRPATPQDADVLTSIQQAAFKPLYERYRDSGNPYLRGPEDVLGRLDSPYFRYYCILQNDVIIGGVLYKCKGKGPFFDSLEHGEYYLQRVYITPELQNRKIAQTAILLCEQDFPDATYFSVDFPEDLIKNRRCYEAAGFRDTGKRLETDPGVVLACFEKHMGLSH